MDKPMFWKGMYRAGLLLGGMLAAAGCAVPGTLSQEMAAMQGNPPGDATDSRGSPSAVEPFGDGRLMIWRDYAHTYTGSGTPVVICERQLAVDSNGSISGWRWRGDACESLHRDRSATGQLQANRQ